MSQDMTADGVWHPTACILCGSNRGIEIQPGLDGRSFERVRRHPSSRAHTCNKALGLISIRTAATAGSLLPLRRRPDGSVEEIGWDAAIGEISQRRPDVGRAYGPETIFYGGGKQGSPSRRALRGRNARAYMSATGRVLGHRRRPVGSGLPPACSAATTARRSSAAKPWCSSARAAIFAGPHGVTITDETHESIWRRVHGGRIHLAIPVLLAPVDGLARESDQSSPQWPFVLTVGRRRGFARTGVDRPHAARTCRIAERPWSDRRRPRADAVSNALTSCPIVTTG
jgi:hypothetical protein